MENKKASSFIFAIIAIIIGTTLYKQFDFEKLTFEKPTLAALYIIVFLFSIFVLIKNAKKGSAK
ncbi:hypothetical protein [Flavobacterium sp. N502540]|uniref:hypothetical protein n=1 Tax=Flavobacterium sp. N502540 TaxID=2986838 RepID=UPI002224EB0A|nr:hypothetical protein [Flavobacterium sp. N502540]